MYLYSDNNCYDEWNDDELNVQVTLQEANLDIFVEIFLKNEQVNSTIHDIFFSNYQHVTKQIASMPVYVREIMKKGFGIEKLENYNEFREVIYQCFRSDLAYELDDSRKIMGPQAMLDLAYFYQNHLYDISQFMLNKIKELAKTISSGDINSFINYGFDQILEKEDDAIRLSLLEWLIQLDTIRGLPHTLRIPRTSIRLKNDIDQLLNKLGFVPVT